ncbi:MAG: hypothetical protein ACXWOL_05300 [Ktedonobacteraceae bacterium]
MMELNRKNMLLSFPVLAVEVATLANLSSYYSYHEPPVVAFLLAISFSVLLIASAILISQDVGRLIRAMLITGGLLLFGVQAASNISEAFLHALVLLPVDHLSLLWNVSPATWTIRSAFIWGGVINIVGLIYWIALGVHFRKEKRSEALASEILKDLLKDKVK